MDKLNFNKLYRQFTSLVMRVEPQTEATRNRIFYRFGYLSEEQFRACMREFRDAVNTGRLPAEMEPEPRKWEFVVQKLNFPTTDNRKNYYFEKMGYTLPTDEEKAEVAREASKAVRLLQFGSDDQIKRVLNNRSRFRFGFKELV